MHRLSCWNTESQKLVLNSVSSGIKDPRPQRAERTPHCRCIRHTLGDSCGCGSASRNGREGDHARTQKGEQRLRQVSWDTHV